MKFLTSSHKGWLTRPSKEEDPFSVYPGYRRAKFKAKDELAVDGGWSLIRWDDNDFFLQLDLTFVIFLIEPRQGILGKSLCSHR